MEFQSFSTDAERSAWVQANATSYSICRFKGDDSPGRYDRAEASSIEEARFVAQQTLKRFPSARCVVYAIAGEQSTYVETIKRS